MKFFLLDTSTSVYSMAISDGSSLLAHDGGVAGPTTAARLAPAVSALFAGAGVTAADMDFFAVTVGPGAFTGLRVGISMVKGLALATGRPVVPISSLALLAMNACQSQIPVSPMFDARKGEVYAAIYDFRSASAPVVREAAADPALFLRGIGGSALFLGDGALRYRELIEEIMGERALFAEGDLHHPRASAGTTLALEGFARGMAIPPAQLLPRYLRLSEAELSRR